MKPKALNASGRIGAIARPVVVVVLEVVAVSALKLVAAGALDPPLKRKNVPMETSFGSKRKMIGTGWLPPPVMSSRLMTNIRIGNCVGKPWWNKILAYVWSASVVETM